jgi:hypothetical protein
VVGGSVGSIVPGPGTAIGAVIGAISGGVAGYYIGKALWSEAAGDAAPERTIDDPGSLAGASTEEVEGAVPSGWVKTPTREGEGAGTRYHNPDRRGEAVRVMPGRATDPNPVKQGPYVRISKDGKVSNPVPLKGNPTLPQP